MSFERYQRVLKYNAFPDGHGANLGIDDLLAAECGAGTNLGIEGLEVRPPMTGAVVGGGRLLRAGLQPGARNGRRTVERASRIASASPMPPGAQRHPPPVHV